MTERELYLRAAHYMQAHGWCRLRGRLGGRVCMSVAMTDVSGKLLPNTEKLNYLIDCSVVAFNDTDCESIDDAIAAFKIAADLAA